MAWGNLSSHITDSRHIVINKYVLSHIALCMDNHDIIARCCSTVHSPNVIAKHETPKGGKSGNAPHIQVHLGEADQTPRSEQAVS